MRANGFTMSSINFINDSWHKEFDDRDFYDKKKLVGRIYNLMVQGMMAPTADLRHEFAITILTEVANGMSPCCTSCGKRLHNIKCKDCKMKSQGILGSLN